MPSYNPIVKNGASGAILYVSLAPRTATGNWQANPTLAAGDVKISLDGGALANLTTLPVVTPAGSKLVKVTLSQAETNGDNLTILFSDAAGDEWNDLTVNLQTAAAAPAVASDVPTAAQNADALLDRADAIETGVTPRGAMRLTTAALAGKVSGAGSGTETFRNAIADSKDRIVSTVDVSGNRTAVATDTT